MLNNRTKSMIGMALGLTLGVFAMAGSAQAQSDEQEVIKWRAAGTPARGQRLMGG